MTKMDVDTISKTLFPFDTSISSPSRESEASVSVSEQASADICISRADVLKHKYSRLDSGCFIVESVDVDEIMKLPPVTPKQRWIPVDYDRYPETYPRAFQEVWITDAYGEVSHRAYDGTRSIKAWMPYVMPKPYEEGEENSKVGKKGVSQNESLYRD